MVGWTCVLALGMPLLAQQVQLPPGAPYIRVHGEATVSAQPDRMQMDVGVISQGATSQAAGEANAKQSNTVVEQLRKLVPAANIKTVNFSINPNYHYSTDGAPPTIMGYTANNTVRLELDDLKALRAVVDAATRSGASNVNRVTFALRDESRARSEALGKAADQAKAGAEALAQRMRVKLGRVLSVEEEQPVIVAPGRQVELAASVKNGGAEAPLIEPGTIEVHASVRLTIEITQ
jgi:uncharacterized protein YggE